MSDDFETVELEISEEDILYRIVDEDGNEVGFAIMEDGEEVEYYYEGFDAEDFEAPSFEIALEEDPEPAPISQEGAALMDLLDSGALGNSDADEGAIGTSAGNGDNGDDLVELEISEDDIVAYLTTEDGEEIGFVIVQDGQEIECYYEGYEHYAEAETLPAIGEKASSDARENATAAPPGVARPPEAGPAEAEADAEPEDHGYLYKMASIVGHKGNKARKKAEVELDKVRGKAEKQANKASSAAKQKAQEVKGKADEAGIGITREDVTHMTEDLNTVAREGAETAKELKEAYDDIMDTFSFLKPGRRRR